eukprot:scaffold5021_cov123-Isochrysis_galbana.AAC.16
MSRWDTTTPSTVAEVAGSARPIGRSAAPAPRSSMSVANVGTTTSLGGALVLNSTYSAPAPASKKNSPGASSSSNTFSMNHSSARSFPSAPWLPPPVKKKLEDTPAAAGTESAPAASGDTPAWAAASTAEVASDGHSIPARRRSASRRCARAGSVGCWSLFRTPEATPPRSNPYAPSVDGAMGGGLSDTFSYLAWLKVALPTDHIHVYQWKGRQAWISAPEGLA